MDTTHKPYVIVVPVMDHVAVLEVLPLAAALARIRDGWIMLLGVVEAGPLASFGDERAAIQRQRDRLDQWHGAVDVPLLTAIYVADSWQEGIADVMRETKADLLLLGCHGDQLWPVQRADETINRTRAVSRWN